MGARTIEGAGVDGIIDWSMVDRMGMVCECVCVRLRVMMNRDELTWQPPVLGRA